MSCLEASIRDHRWQKQLYVAVLALVVLFSGQARAEEWTRKSFVLPDGAFEITGDPARPAMLEVTAYPNAFGEPIHIAPHFYWGVTNDLSLGISHREGLCLNGCNHPYNDAGFDLLYRLTGSRNVELNLHAGVPMRSFTPFEIGVEAGLLGRVNIGSVTAFVFDPSVYVAFTNRNGGVSQELNLPFWFYFQASRVVVPFVGSGAHGPFDGFFNELALPLEGGMLFDVAQNVDVGFSLRFHNLVGPHGNADAKSLYFLGRFRF